MTDSPSTAASAAQAIFRVENLGRYYTDGNVTALSEVTFTINPGEYVAIIGPSGSGKSTLLNLLGALDVPTTGDIYFDGQPLRDRSKLDRIRAEKIGFVFQSFHLLPTLSAVENVQIPMFESKLSPRDRTTKALELLGRVNLEKRANHLPQKLSVGERQRVAIARSLANDPVVLLADEPTGNLDSKNGEEVLRLFDTLHREHKMTLVVITHSPEVAERAERVLTIRDGKLASDRRNERKA